MRILGVDPGYALMGYGVIERRGSRLKAIDYGSISTGPSAPMPERLKFLYSSLMDIIAETEPEAASFEELFYNTNAKTVINVGQARGVAVLACVNSGVEVAEYTPLQIKQALVGYGRAEKKQVQQMVKTILGLDKVPKPDDTADALAAAICHANSMGGNATLKNAIDQALAKEDAAKKNSKKKDDFRIIR
ncbi:MAG: crossover junction endodeoxyribonuclease RuvC [Anaerovoracaceae bacterium]|jgi:crossover junction endodeoxyribonuclease RuvC